MVLLRILGAMVVTLALVLFWELRNWAIQLPLDRQIGKMIALGKSCEKDGLRFRML